MARQVLDNGVILPSEYSDDWYDDMTSNLTKLDEVIGSDAEKLDESDVGAAAISNDYDDLDDKPTYNILRRASVTLTAGGTGNYSDLDSDSKIKAGDYVLDAANKLYSITAIDAANSTYTVSAAALFTVTDKAELGAAALSNSYDDLNNLPGYGILRFCSTAITDNSNVAFANISSTSKIAAGDFLLDTAGKMYVIASVDTVNETAAVTTPLTQLAVDSGVMHLSGNETVAGIKSFSDDTFIKSLNFTSEVPSPSSSSSSILPIITTITYGDGSPSVQARLNVRVLADGSKSFYPHENNQISLGLTSRRFKDFYTYLINGLNPSSLFLPDLNKGIDISGFITLGTTNNIYTPPSDGWICMKGRAVSNSGFAIIQGDVAQSCYNLYDFNSSDRVSFCSLPVKAGVQVEIWLKQITSLDSAKFFPCLGNV